MSRLLQYVWDMLKGSRRGRLVATAGVVTAIVTVTSYQRERGAPEARFLIGFIVLGLLAELYLEYMTGRRERTSDGRLKLTWGDLGIMVLLFSILICIVGFFMLP